MSTTAVEKTDNQIISRKLRDLQFGDELVVEKQTMIELPTLDELKAITKHKLDGDSERVEYAFITKERCLVFGEVEDGTVAVSLEWHEHREASWVNAMTLDLYHNGDYRFVGWHTYSEGSGCEAEYTHYDKHIFVMQYGRLSHRKQRMSYVEFYGQIYGS